MSNQKELTILLVSPVDNVEDLTIYFDTSFGLGETSNDDGFGNEAVRTIQYLYRAIPDLKEDFELKSKINSIDISNYEETVLLSQTYNRAIQICKGKWKLLDKKPAYFNKRANGTFLRHILRQCYERSVDNPSSLNSYAPFSSAVYGETSFELVETVIKHTRLSNNDIFIDLGSGVGQVVLQVAACTDISLCLGIEKADYPALCADKMLKSFYTLMQFYGKPYQKIELEKADFLLEENRDRILQASVIFVNNYAFGPDVDHQLMEIFKNLNEGCRIVSSKAYRPRNFRITDRNLCDLASILRTRDLPPMKVSWTSTNLSYILHTVDRSLLEEYFEAMRPRVRRADGSLRTSKPRRCNSEKNLSLNKDEQENLLAMESRSGEHVEHQPRSFHHHTKSLNGAFNPHTQLNFVRKKNGRRILQARRRNSMLQMHHRKASLSSTTLTTTPPTTTNDGNSPQGSTPPASDNSQNCFSTLSSSSPTSSTLLGCNGNESNSNNTTISSSGGSNTITTPTTTRKRKSPPRVGRPRRAVTIAAAAAATGGGNGNGNNQNASPATLGQIRRNLKSRARIVANEGVKRMRRELPTTNAIGTSSSALSKDLSALHDETVAGLFHRRDLSISQKECLYSLDEMNQQLISHSACHSAYLQQRQCVPLAIKQLVSLYQQQLLDFYHSTQSLAQTQPQPPQQQQHSALFYQIHKQFSLEQQRQKQLEKLLQSGEQRLQQLKMKAAKQLHLAMKKLDFHVNLPSDLISDGSNLLHHREELRERLCLEQTTLRSLRQRNRELKANVKEAGGCRVLQKLVQSNRATTTATVEVTQNSTKSLRTHSTTTAAAAPTQPPHPPPMGYSTPTAFPPPSPSTSKFAATRVSVEAMTTTTATTLPHCRPQVVWTWPSSNSVNNSQNHPQYQLHHHQQQQQPQHLSMTPKQVTVVQGIPHSSSSLVIPNRLLSVSAAAAAAAASINNNPLATLAAAATASSANRFSSPPTIHLFHQQQQLQQQQQRLSSPTSRPSAAAIAGSPANLGVSSSTDMVSSSSYHHHPSQLPQSPLLPQHHHHLQHLHLQQLPSTLPPPLPPPPPPSSSQPALPPHQLVDENDSFNRVQQWLEGLLPHDDVATFQRLDPPDDDEHQQQQLPSTISSSSPAATTTTINPINSTMMTMAFLKSDKNNARPIATTARTAALNVNQHLLDQICHLSQAFVKESEECCLSPPLTTTTATQKPTKTLASKVGEDEQNDLQLTNSQFSHLFPPPLPPPSPPPPPPPEATNLPPRERWRSKHTLWRCSLNSASQEPPPPPFV